MTLNNGWNDHTLSHSDDYYFSLSHTHREMVLLLYTIVILSNWSVTWKIPPSTYWNVSLLMGIKWSKEINISSLFIHNHPTCFWWSWWLRWWRMKKRRGRREGELTSRSYFNPPFPPDGDTADTVKTRERIGEWSLNSKVFKSKLIPFDILDFDNEILWKIDDLWNEWLFSHWFQNRDSQIEKGRSLRGTYRERDEGMRERW